MEELKWIDYGFDDKISKMNESELLNSYQSTKDKQYLHEYISRLLLYKIDDQNIEKLLLEELFGRKIIDIIIQDEIAIDFYTCTIISNHPYLLEYFLSNGNTQVIENIKHNIHNINIEGITLAEYLFKNDLIDQYTITSILDCPDLLKFIKQYHKEELITKLDPMYFLTPKNGKLLLDELIELQIDCVLGEVIEMIVINEVIKRKQYHLLANLSRYAALYKIDGEKTIFEFLLENNIECKHVISNLDKKDKLNLEIIDILKKHNRYDLLGSLEENALISKSKSTGKTILEDLLDKGIVPKLSVIKSPTTVNIFRKYNKYELLSACTETLLMERQNNNKMLIEELLERNLPINADPITYVELAHLIYTYKRKDLYQNISLNTLLNHYDLNTSFLDLILEEIKQDPSIKIKDIDPHASYVELSQIYLAYARHGFDTNLTAEQLLSNDADITLIEFMIQFDKKTTLEKIVTPELLQNPKIATLIKAVNMEEDLSTLSVAVDEVKEEYLNNILKKHTNIQIDDDSRELLDTLIRLMDDGQTDKKALEILEAVYIPLLASSSEYKDEIKRLIEIKQNNPNVSIRMGNEGSCYCPPTKIIYIDSTVISTLRHEIGHLLYDDLSEHKEPKALENLLIHMRLSKKFKQSAKLFAIYHTKLKNQIEEFVEKTYMHKYDESITQEKRNEIAKYIETVHQSEELLRGYILDYVQITVDDFIEKDRDIKKSMMVDAIIRTRYGHVLAISDIIDAVYEGEYVEGRLEDEKGLPIIGKFGHGSDYYGRGIRWVFDEMIANYSLISKTPNNIEAIDMFKKYVGEELYTLLKEYYDKKILNSRKYSMHENRRKL